MINNAPIQNDNVIVEASHEALWSRIQKTIKCNRLPQALLFIASRHLGVGLVARRLASLLLCHASSKPCGQCDACLLFKAGTHPDLRIIAPESEGGVIKIEQIRGLQERIYQTPQCGDVVVVLIEQADKLNPASANALLKILEEPPSYVHYILTAELLNAIPATIISRTQRIIFPDTQHDATDYCALGQFYAPETSRGILYNKRHEMTGDLLGILERRVSPCTVAAAWSKFPLDDVMWLMYLILAQLVQRRLCQVQDTSTRAADPPTQLANAISSIELYRHLDTVYAILKKLSHNIAMNTTLILEHLLAQFVRDIK